MAKKSKKKSKVRQNYLPIVVLNNNVKSAKKKVSQKSRHRYNIDDDVDRGGDGKVSGDKDTVVYIQNYPPPGTPFRGRINDAFERRAGSGSGSSSHPYVARSEPAGYQVPVAAASSGYGHGGGGGGCGHGGCGEELSLFEGLIFLGALAAAIYFLNNQILMFIGRRRRRGEGLFGFMSDLIPQGKSFPRRVFFSLHSGILQRDQKNVLDEGTKNVPKIIQY
jgi:hypothetical protein